MNNPNLLRFLVALPGVTTFFLASTPSGQAASMTVPPTVRTDPPSAISLSNATLNGAVIANSAFAFAWFEWGTTTSYGSQTIPIYLTNGFNNVAIHGVLTDLTPGITYHYRASATNAFGIAHGADQVFRPASPPYTIGRLVCVDERPFANVPVTVELRSRNLTQSVTNLTDKAGVFRVLLEGGAVVTPAEYHIYSTACPSEEWVFPTTSRFADLGDLVARQCTAAARTPPGIVLCLPFDDRPGPVAANLAGGNDGSLFESNRVAALTGGPGRTNGLVGGALHFDGLNDYVEVPSYPEVEIGANDFSIIAWIKLDAAETRARVIVEQFDAAGSRGYSFRLAGTSTNLLALRLADGLSNLTYASSLAVPADGSWRHVAVTSRHDGAINNLQFYLDGVADSQGSVAGSSGSLALNTPTPVRIGASSGAPGSFFRGAVDELALFRRALLPSEIRSIVRAGTNGLSKARTCAPAIIPAIIPPNCCGGAAPLRAPAAASTTTVSVPIQVCNQTGVAQPFCVSFGSGSTSLSPISTGCLNPGQCVTLTVQVPVPASGGLSTLTYYVNPGNCGSGPTSGQPNQVVIPAVTNQISARLQTIQAFAGPPQNNLGATGAVATFALNNLNPFAVALSYRLSVVQPNLVEFQSAQLTGETSGQFLVLAPGGSVTLPANVAFTLPDPLVTYGVLLEIDWLDGQGYRKWISADLDRPIPATCRASLSTNMPAGLFIRPGSPALLQIAATSAMPPISYRWRKNRVPIPGPAGAGESLSINAVAPADEGRYDVIVMDGCGGVISQPAVLLLSDKVRLDITREHDTLQLRWPAMLGGFAVQRATTLAPAPNSNWVDVAETPNLQSGYFRLSSPVSGLGGFYRLSPARTVPPASSCDD